MTTNIELRILADGVQSETSGLTIEEREELLHQAFIEATADQPANFMGLNFDKWRQDAEVSLHKGICEDDSVFNKILEAAKIGETNLIQYVTGLAVALVTPYGWLAALLAAVIVPFILSHIKEDLCEAWNKLLKEKGWLE